MQEIHRAEFRPTILHLISGLGTGGAEMMLWRLAANARQVRHHVISLQGVGAIGERLRAGGTPVDALNLPHPASAVTAIPRLALAARRAKPAIVQGWMTHGNLAATFAASVASAPLLWNVRQSLVDMQYEKHATQVVLRATAALSGRPRAIIYNSRAGAEQHEAIGYPSAKRLLIPNGFDTDRLRPDPASRASVRNDLGLMSDEVVVGMIGRFHPMKNHAGFIDAMRQVAEHYPKARLLLAGSGTDGADVRHMLDGAGLAGRALALGNRSDIPTLMRALDIVVNLSVHGEGFPNVVGEAMATGIPCIVSDVGDSAYVVGQTGAVVRPNDMAGSIAAIEALLAMTSGERCERGLLARARIVAEFGIEHIVDRYETTYLEAIRNNMAARQAG